MTAEFERLQKYLKNNRSLVSDRAPVKLHNKTTGERREVGTAVIFPTFKIFEIFDIDSKKLLLDYMKESTCQEIVAEIKKIEADFADMIDCRKVAVEAGGDGYSELFSREIKSLYKVFEHSIVELNSYLNNRINEDYFNSTESLVKNLCIVGECEFILYWRMHFYGINEKTLIDHFKIIDNFFLSDNTKGCLTENERYFIDPSYSIQRLQKKLHDIENI